ncbi:MAG: hypothetical protein JWQ18_27 [Conexibacter sp.]|nr:hypothetical protein [Conexibacter sp.]
MTIKRDDGTYGPGASRQQRLAQIGEIIWLTNPEWPGTVTQEQFDRTLADRWPDSQRRPCPTAKHARMLPGADRPIRWERLREIAIAVYLGGKAPQDGLARSTPTPDLDEDEARWAIRMVHRRHATRLGEDPEACRLRGLDYDDHATELATDNGGRGVVPSRGRIVAFLGKGWDECLMWAGCYVAAAPVRLPGTPRDKVILAVIKEFGIAPTADGLAAYAKSRNVALARRQRTHGEDRQAAIDAFAADGATLSELVEDQPRPDFTTFPVWPADIPRPTVDMPPAHGQHTRPQIIDAVEQYDDWLKGPDAPATTGVHEAYLHWSEQQRHRPSYDAVVRAGGLLACLAEVQRRREDRQQPQPPVDDQMAVASVPIAVVEVSELDQLLRDRGGTFYPELIRFAQQHATFTIEQFIEATGFKPSAVRNAVSRLVAVRILHAPLAGAVSARPLSLIAAIGPRTQEILEAARGLDRRHGMVGKANDNSLVLAERLDAVYEVCRAMSQPFTAAQLTEVLGRKGTDVYRDVRALKDQHRLVVERRLKAGRGRDAQRLYTQDQAPHIRSREQQLYEVAVTLDQSFIVEQIAEAAGVAVTTVKPRLRKLAAIGSLDIEKRRQGSGGQARHFYTCTGRPPDQHQTARRPRHNRKSPA